MHYDAQELMKLPFVDAAEAAYLLRLKPQTIRKWVSINGRSQRPHNPDFPTPVSRRKLRFRTSEVLAYMDGPAASSGATFPSP